MKISIQNNLPLLIVLGSVLAFTVLSAPFAMAKGGPNAGCTTIPEGVLETLEGDVIPTGFIKEGSRAGYNYQAQLFNGDWGGDKLTMKWNDAWLSNKDCDADEKLDRHLGYGSYIGSGAWLTNHFSGSYEGLDGKMHKWTYFLKIVAAPADATKVAGVWYAVNGDEIGPDIWGQFIIIQEVSNDSGAGENGLLYKSPVRAGLGNW